MAPERYALIGTGGRAGMYVEALTGGGFAEVAQLVAWADRNPGRLDVYETQVAGSGAAVPARFDVAELESAVREHAIDRVIVTTPDSTHAEFVARALEAGADVVVEKPLTIDVAGIRRIRAAIAASGREVITTFNYRYSPRNSALRRLIQEGELGTVTSVTFEWVLDTSHGADYFRRWHRDKANSGGLLVHKAAHHFDLVNWWIADEPVRVFASGGLRFYGEEAARARGLDPSGRRGSDDPDDPFALDLAGDPRLKALFLDAEHHDGYRRDQSVFDADITIEDNLAVVVDYARGATLSYALNAHSPWEGYRVAVNGTLGRAELEVVERGMVPSGATALVVDPSAVASDDVDPVRPRGERLVLQRHWESAHEVTIPAGIGGHGGGDAYLLRHLFERTVADPPLERVAGVDDGIRAISVGIAGNLSLATGDPVRIAELLA